MAQLQWVRGEEAYTYTRKNVLYKGKIKGKDKELLTLEDLNKILGKYSLKGLKRFPRVNWLSPVEFYFSSPDSNLVKINIKKKEAVIVNPGHALETNAEIDENHFHIAYTVENNLYLAKSNGEVIPISQEKNKGIVYGQTVHRNEFGIEKGIFWSPGGNYLAFYRKDETDVSDYPILNINTRVAEVENIKYPMAGMKSEKVTIGVYHIESNSVVYLKTGEPDDHYLTNVTWSPDEKYLYVAELNRDQTVMNLNKYDVKTGEKTATLFTEKNKKYVEPLHGPYFLPGSADRFLWMSKRSGYNHIYLYNTDGELLEKVTDGNFDVLDIIGTNNTGNIVFYSAVDEEYPLQQHLYSINLESMEVVKLSTADGCHRGELSSGQNYILDYYSSSKIAHEITLIDINGMEIKKVYPDYNPLSEYKLGEIKIGTVAANDGTPLYYRMILPVDFNPSRKYPVLVYVYGGPHVQLISNRWRYGANPFLEYFAQHGYIVFTLDNRGSDHRGLKFEQATFGHLGTVEIEDQIKGIEYLTTLPYVDAERIGVHGWSFGGFMTTSLMLRKPDYFKVGVAGAPVIDWAMYEVMYGERYMNTPESNPEGYQEANLLNYVDQLKGKLLLIHGTSDKTVVWQHTLKFLDACIQKNIQVDYFVYPNQEHGIRGAARLHLNQKIIDYFNQYL